jgi:hypothetical protein
MRKGIELIELPWLKQNLGAQVFRDLAGMCGTFENQDWLAQDDGRQAEKETGARRRAHGCRGSERVAAETGVRGSKVDAPPNPSWTGRFWDQPGRPGAENVGSAGAHPARAGTSACSPRNKSGQAGPASVRDTVAHIIRSDAPTN